MGKPLFKSAKQIAVDAYALKLAAQRGDSVSSDKSTVRYEDDDSAYINTVLPDVVVTPKYKNYDDYNKTIAARDRRTLEQQQREMNNYVRAGMNKAGEVVAGAMMMLPPVAAADPIAAGVGRVLGFAAPRLRAAAKASQATANNIADITKWTPEQWTTAQDAAIARGGIAEAQRLRDLHFKVKAPYTKLIDENELPLHLYHGTNSNWNEFNPEFVGKNTGNTGVFGKGIYGTGILDEAQKYGKEIKDLYFNAETTYAPKTWIERYLSGKFYNKGIKNPKGKAREIFSDNPEYLEAVDKNLQNILNSDAVLSLSKDGKTVYEIVVPKPNQIKSADAITYAPDGTRIPLGERDNFNMNDIRYALPFVLPSSKSSVEDEVGDTQLNN